MAGERSDLGKIFITDGGIYDANTTYEKLTMVSYNNSTYITLRTVTGVTPSNDRINYGLMAQGFTATYLSSVTAEDVQGLVVEAGSETPAQSLINAIADRVANQLVSNSDLQDILSDYILKSAIANNLSITEEGKVLDARQGKALNNALGTANTTIASMKTVSEADLSTDYTQQRTTTIAKAKKLNGLPLVHIRVIETYSLNIPGGQNILYLPSGYRPSEQQVVPGLILIGTDSAMHYAPIVISPSGGIRQDISNSMRGLYIDTWIKI